MRREFLKGSGILMGSIAAGSALAALAPSTAWAVELKTLSTAEGEVLMKMGRTLYPHKKLADAVYALLAKDLDAKAAGDAATAKLLRAAGPVDYPRCAEPGRPARSVPEHATACLPQRRAPP